MAQQQPMQQLFDNLAETNRTIWNQWLEGARKGNFSPMNKEVERNYRQNIDMAEKIVKGGLRAQSEFVEQWCRSVTASDQVPKPLLDMTENFRASMDSWIGAREELWSNWFDGARKVDLEHLMPLANGQGEFLKIWEDLSRKTVEIQEGMSRAASNVVEETEKATEKASQETAKVVSAGAAAASGSSSKRSSSSRSGGKSS